jgi:hypothetical protein
MLEVGFSGFENLVFESCDRLWSMGPRVSRTFNRTEMFSFCWLSTWKSIYNSQYFPSCGVFTLVTPGLFENQIAQMDSDNLFADLWSKIIKLMERHFHWKIFGGLLEFQEFQGATPLG